MRKLTKSRRYLLSESLVNQLKELKKYKIIESRFVRLAIQEKIERDLPKIHAEEKRKQSKDYCPF